MSKDFLLNQDSKTFRFRFEFEPMLLKSFLAERYALAHNKDWLEDIYPHRVTLNGAEVFDHTLVQCDDWIEYLHKREDEKILDFNPVVLYEDEWILAISKPDNTPVSPSGSYYFNSLAIRVKEYFEDPQINPLHRLDLETSGVILFGKTKKARGKLQPLFEKKKVYKHYQAITYQKPDQKSVEGDIVAAENSKIYTKLELKESEQPNSQTLIHEVRPWGKYYRVWVQPITGKTNQIRVHLAAIGCPIVGDKKYFPDEEVYLEWINNRNIDSLLSKLILPRQALHCEKVRLTNPLSKEEVQIEDTSPFWEGKIRPLEIVGGGS